MATNQNSEVRAANPAEAVRALLRNPEAFGTTLFVLAVDLWPDCLGDPEDPERGPWHASTFRSMLEERFGVRLPKVNLDKLMAAVTVVTTDLFWKNADRFIVLANVLAGDEFAPGEFEIADSAECAWAITEALILDPPDDDDPEPFSDDIRYYIGAVLRDEGYVTPPDVLRVAIDSDLADRVRYSFSDDPEMFSGIYAVQQSKTDDVETVLRDCLLELRDQLRSLPLENGSTVEFEKRIAIMLRLNEPTEPLPGPGIL